MDIKLTYGIDQDKYPIDANKCQNFLNILTGHGLRARYNMLAKPFEVNYLSKNTDDVNMACSKGKGKKPPKK